MNVIDYILYLIFGGREPPPPDPPITGQDVDDTFDFAADVEFDEEWTGTEWDKQTERLESIGPKTEEIEEIDTHIPLWKQMLGLD